MKVILYVCLIVFVMIIDYIWLTLNKHRYNMLVTTIQGKSIQINTVGAILSYVCVILTLIFFAIPKVEQQSSTNKHPLNLFFNSLVWGGGLGFLIYGVFNFTNIAIFKNYNIKIAALDTLWGTILYTIACFVFVYASRKT